MCRILRRIHISKCEDMIFLASMSSRTWKIARERKWMSGLSSCVREIHSLAFLSSIILLNDDVKWCWLCIWLFCNRDAIVHLCAYPFSANFACCESTEMLHVVWNLVLLWPSKVKTDKIKLFSPSTSLMSNL